jgi:DNA-binding transcriptional LysR family regulator
LAHIYGLLKLLLAIHHTPVLLSKCVMNHMGITVLPEIAVADELARGLLVALPWRATPIRVVTQMIRHKKSRLTPALSSFVDMVTQTFGDQTLSNPPLAAGS